MPDPSAEIPIQPDLVADSQSLAKELGVSWSWLITLALKDFIRRYRSRKGLIDQINAAYSDGLDNDEAHLRQAMRSTHRHII
ncbi:MAG: CopG family transcriptional regulator [Cyanobacteria bacterium P01_A01_bin.114]